MEEKFRITVYGKPKSDSTDFPRKSGRGGRPGRRLAFERFPGKASLAGFGRAVFRAEHSGFPPYRAGGGIDGKNLTGLAGQLHAFGKMIPRQMEAFQKTFVDMDLLFH
ncbi:MAG: hypothetical protein LBW85_10235 [Deltaproteobacteria bacterium]|jgi:hypothetical protein|nr:hypothetical protein [Deltaproteobacteria bacterium]